MEFMGVSLIVTGLVIIAFSLFNRRHPTSSKKHIAIHQRMTDDQIGKQFAQGLPRADAKLGIYFGLFFILVGCLRIGLIKWMWWGI